MMSVKLIRANELLLNKVFIQKGAGFHNKVTLISYESVERKTILVTYRSLTTNSHTTPSMELKQFIALHHIDFDVTDLI